MFAFTNTHAHTCVCSLFVYMCSANKLNHAEVSIATISAAVAGAAIDIGTHTQFEHNLWMHSTHHGAPSVVNTTQQNGLHLNRVFRVPHLHFHFAFIFNGIKRQSNFLLPHLVSTHQHMCVRFIVSILFKFVEQMFKRNKEWPKQIQSTPYSMLTRPLAVTAIYFACGRDIPFACHLCVCAFSVSSNATLF